MKKHNLKSTSEHIENYEKTSRPTLLGYRRLLGQRSAKIDAGNSDNISRVTQLLEIDN